MERERKLTRVDFAPRGLRKNCAALEFGPFLGVKFASDQLLGPRKSYAAAAPTMAG